MISRSLLLILLFFVCQIAKAQKSLPDQMVLVKGGTFVPLYGNDSSKVILSDFLMDKYPVTNGAYLDFVKQYPEWQKENVKKLFADGNYLRHWSGGLSIGAQEEMINDSPVTNISWFSAKSYCECQGKRLPTVEEWEFTALASEDKANASGDAAFYQRSLDWYSKPNPAVLPAVQNSFRNFYEVYGMVGLVWEWTFDFNSNLLQGESRANNSLDRQLFCGAGSTGAKDTGNYVAFMRYAFRSSLKANYTVANLGFRCAKDI